MVSVVFEAMWRVVTCCSSSRRLLHAGWGCLGRAGCRLAEVRVE